MTRPMTGGVLVVGSVVLQLEAVVPFPFGIAIEVVIRTWLDGGDDGPSRTLNNSVAHPQRSSNAFQPQFGR
jgi:hypothetical protein